MAEITQEFNEPFSTRTVALPSSFSASVVGISGRPYLLDTENGQYRRQGVAVVQQRNTSDNRDLLLLPQEVWRQQQQSWHYGAGQSNLDRDDTQLFRYQDSFAIDPWNKWQLRLVNDTEQLTAITVDPFLNQPIWLSNTGSYLTVFKGTTISWFSAPLESFSTPVGTTTFETEIIDIADDGLVATVLTADGYVWYVDSPTATPQKWSNHQYNNPTFIAWEKDYLLVGDGNELYNAVKDGASPDLIYTHPNPEFRWYSAASGSQFIYVMGIVGDRTTIHKVGIKTDGTGLLPCVVAATLPDGEVGSAIDSYVGYEFIGTSLGVRMAQADGNGDLVLGPIIPTDSPVRCFEGQDRFMWFGKSQINSDYDNSGGFNTQDADSFPSSPVGGLGRMDLSTFTSPLAPAWANDLYTSVPGAGTNNVNSVVTFDGRRIFSINKTGVFFEADYPVEAGWLIQGTVSFSVEDLKTGLYTQAKWLPLVGSVAIDFSYDSEPYQRVMFANRAGSIRSDNVTLYGRQFSRLNARYVLFSGESELLLPESPVMTRWEVRAVPVKGRASRWSLPIMNYDTVEIDNVIYNRNVAAEFQTLLDIAQSGNIFTLQENGVSYQVYATDFAWQPEKISVTNKGWQGVFTLVVEEVA